MIEIRHLSHTLGKNIILDDVNLTIPDSTVMGLVGINGAGKTTLLRLMSGGHQFMAAAQTAETEIRAGSQNQPPFFSAGVGLFHHKHIIQANIHSSSYFFTMSQYCFAACSILFLPYS